MTTSQRVHPGDDWCALGASHDLRYACEPLDTLNGRRLRELIETEARPLTAARVWCADCRTLHLCTTDHGPDDHGGSSICCPKKQRAAQPSSLVGTGVARAVAEASVRMLLGYIGENADREGLVDTPARVVRALAEMTSGYTVDIEALLTRTFESDGYGGLVIVRGVDFVSMCEHHMLTFTGKATVGYIPGDGRVVGLSKLARLVDAFARRLQVQERMTEQIADAIAQYLQPEGIGVVITATHSCLAHRGAGKANAEMVTSSLRGALFDKGEARAEFMRLA